MTTENMKSHLLKWHPEWNKKTIDKWRPNQIIAIYMKEKNKLHITNDNINIHKQLSFF